MASKKSAAVPVRPVPRLYLQTPVVSDPDTLAATFAKLPRDIDIAAVLLRLAASDERTLTARIKTLAPIVQKSGAALLLEGHSELVARSGADGAHIAGPDALKAALSSLKPDFIVGAGGLVSRHDAMVAGEAGADYVLFGEPDAAGHRPSVEAIVERIAWWAEVFEPPCVGHAQTLDEAEAIAAAGADFILMGDAIWNDQRGPDQALTDATRRILKGHAGALQASEGRTP